MFGDAILAYQGQEERSGPYRFYPAILVSAWASFEAYVRIYSELFVRTAKNLPATISDSLLENDPFVDAQGRIQKRAKFQSLLGRYWWLWQFGYSCDFDRGSRIWQLGEAALRARNELVHYELQGMPSLKTIELWAHLEAILLLFIGPSAQIGKSVVPDIYELYGVLCELGPLLENTKKDRISSTPVWIWAVSCSPVHSTGLTKTRYLHRFRKTFATKMHHAGMPLRDLQVILGHKSLTTTEKSDLKATHMRALADKAFSF